MNIKRILSTALTVVIIFTTIMAVIPFSAGAAYSESSASANAGVPGGYKEANLDSEEIKVYLEEYLKYNFKTAAEMLDYELQGGYLYAVNSQGNSYTLYINKYTGFVYYVNNYTGQILTSNPINPGYLSSIGSVAVQQQYREALMSQIIVTFSDAANNYEYTSHKWAAGRAQLSGRYASQRGGEDRKRFLHPCADPQSVSRRCGGHPPPPAGRRGGMAGICFHCVLSGTPQAPPAPDRSHWHAHAC